MKINFFEKEGFAAATLAEMCRAEIWRDADASLVLHGLCTDSREADATTAFVAMRGERVDGHDYIGAALQNGCRAVICERVCEEIEESGALAIVVKDSEMALSLMANAYKKELTAKTVAVTGSVGKTTTKDMIAAVLAVRGDVYRSEGNHNSVVGMPLSVMEMPRSAAYGVLEMGMSGFGEIERMSITAEPDIAVITNVGSSHMELLGSRENICRAKLEILCGLKDGGHLILNGDEPMLANVRGKSYHTHYVSLSRGNAEFSAQNIRVGSKTTRFEVVWKGNVYENMQIRVLGRHNVYAALYAFAVGVLSGMSPEEVRVGLLNFLPTGMRQNAYSLKEMTVIEDCYNASPESMIAAIDVLVTQAEQKGGRSIAVLGDMLELGKESGSLHRRVGTHLASCGVDEVYLLGHEAMQISVGARQAGMSHTRIHSFPELSQMEEAGASLQAGLQPRDVLLFKASRAVGLEKMILQIKEKL